MNASLSFESFVSSFSASIFLSYSGSLSPAFAWGESFWSSYRLAANRSSYFAFLFYNSAFLRSRTISMYCSRWNSKRLRRRAMTPMDATTSGVGCSVTIYIWGYGAADDWFAIGGELFGESERCSGSCGLRSIGLRCFRLNDSCIFLSYSSF